LSSNLQVKTEQIQVVPRDEVQIPSSKQSLSSLSYSLPSNMIDTTSTSPSVLSSFISSPLTTDFSQYTYLNPESINPIIPSRLPTPPPPPPLFHRSNNFPVIPLPPFPKRPDLNILFSHYPPNMRV
jgi:hypothetical protein